MRSLRVPTPGYRFGNDGEPDPVFNHAANGIESVQPHPQSQPLAGSRCLFIQKVLPLKRDVDSYHRQFTIPAGLHLKREYLLTIGRRR